jgi:hypothetical protein
MSLHLLKLEKEVMAESTEKVCTLCFMYEEDFDEPFNAEGECPGCVQDKEDMLSSFEYLVSLWPKLTKEQKFTQIEYILNPPLA